MGVTRIPKSNWPEGPGLFLCKAIKRGVLTVVTVHQDKAGVLIATGPWKSAPLSEFLPESRWWGPLEIQK